MSRETWNLIKNSKGFYINTYRRAGSVLFLSMILNLLLTLAIYYTYFNRSEPDFYASNGITPPVQLTPLDSPNYTSVPLLADDDQESAANINKTIPQ
ncbi:MULTISPECIES: type IVB secretion system protein IcmM/DotJ [Legionella]|uniref:Phosphoesterase n=1 Tax=Legionella septentrionalis TaxID=2498109 RepID=A0A3S0X096_9GAMM|nr:MULTISPECIES: type IVB secretion system protein IcmM/DotJ [Legionella]MCP0913194.1 type IVB secretion system protein IcmM/DotJ [Legionella sp. 27cVA30]RUQ88046.1 phosphoesterase [Legionella septentrionalis]RUR02425.1 phosphoesterase [Legionella septentrionalis]RUR10369.1 phosphoesterase [Legionella septentrionalis]RUR17083.1 phosphoesterase [Legionella septentrionalis]